MPNILDKMTNSLNGYVADAVNIKGAFLVVNGKSNLPSSILQIGMLIFDSSDNKYYTYGADGWNEYDIATKDFVNSSIATATANFLGTYNIVDDLGLTTLASHADIASAIASKLASLGVTITNNDYVFVAYPDATEPNEYTQFDRYKYNGQLSEWEFEYTLNNSSFTAQQWSAINSGITDTKVSSYDTHIANTSNPHSVTKTQVGLGNVDNTSDATKKSDFTGSIANSNTGFVTGGDVYTALSGKQDTITFNTTYNASTNKAATMDDISSKTLSASGNGISLGGTIGSPTIEVTSGSITSGNTSVVNGGTVYTAVSAKQDTIDTTHKLSADLVNDSSTTNKFVTSTEKNTWNAKQDALTYSSLSDDTIFAYIGFKTDGTLVKQEGGGGSITPNPESASSANLEKATIGATVYQVQNIELIDTSYVVDITFTYSDNSTEVVEGTYVIDTVNQEIHLEV